MFAAASLATDLAVKEKTAALVEQISMLVTQRLEIKIS